MPKILLLGAYGTLGKELCYLLAKEGYTLVLSGKDKTQLEKVVHNLQAHFPQANLSMALLNTEAEDFADKLRALNPDMVVNTTGPYYNKDLTLVETIIAQKRHYVDVAEVPGYLKLFLNLDENAKAQEVVAITGAGTMPALSNAVIAHFAGQFGLVREIEVNMIAGSGLLMGQAFYETVLSGAGQPFDQLMNGRWQKQYGWQSMQRVYLGDNLGEHWQSVLDAPECHLLPLQYKSLKTLRFRAGVGSAFLHKSLWALSWLARWRIVKNFASLAATIKRFSDWYNRKSKGLGGMIIHIRGSSHRFQPRDIHWKLIAQKEEGMKLAAIPAFLTIKKITQGVLEPGARICTDVFSFNEYFEIADQLSVYQTTENLLR